MQVYTVQQSDTVGHSPEQYFPQKFNTSWNEIVKANAGTNSFEAGDKMKLPAEDSDEVDYGI